MASQPVLLFDGDCGFCGRTIEIVRRIIQPRVQFVPWQYADLAALNVTEDRADREVLCQGFLSAVSLRVGVSLTSGDGRRIAARQAGGRSLSQRSVRWWRPERRRCRTR
ncbi:DCC1-like thiol-disulfide oxidoreductase family protein [Streptomyces sp. NPDC002467]|uniref:DCC1-like thiol-disulfide oxidoreductase family protein n=1 Tax=Streptomyces sp. NPDC002467 TaxID=3364647 RepID=UPI0036935306